MQKLQEVIELLKICKRTLPSLNTRSRAKAALNFKTFTACSWPTENSGIFVGHGLLLSSNITWFSSKMSNENVQENISKREAKIVLTI